MWIKPEKRKYMGPKKMSQIPRGAIVTLVGRIGKTALFIYKGKMYTAPIRILHKIRGDRG